MKTLFQLLAALIVLCASSILAQTNNSSPPLRAAQLMGLKVEDSDGQKIGAIRNLIVDMRTGQFKYAVIGSGGFLGIRSTVRVAPAQALSTATIIRQTVALNTTLEHWTQAPAFDSSQLAALGEPDRARQIADYFNQRDIRFANTPNQPLSATGSSSGEQSDPQPATLKFASDLIGKRVVNRRQQPIGEVLDLLVSFGPPHPAFAIISTGKFLHHGQRYAVPLSTLHQNAGNKLVLDATAADLMHAPPFNQEIWNKPVHESGPAVYTYSKSGE